MTKEQFRNELESSSQRYWTEMYDGVWIEDEESAHEWGFTDGVLCGMSQKNDVLKYCEPHLHLMWAATIIGIILNCDARDSKQELEKYKRATT